MGNWVATPTATENSLEYCPMNRSLHLGFAAGANSRFAVEIGKVRASVYRDLNQIASRIPAAPVLLTIADTPNIPYAPVQNWWFTMIQESS